MLGDIHAAGMSLGSLKTNLLKSFEGKIDTQQVSVELETGKFPVFVTGMVVRPGKVETDHPLTALEAVMECGGPDFSRANLKEVVVSRLENGRYIHFKINLRDALDGKSKNSFYLKPQDIVYIRERFVWF